MNADLPSTRFHVLQKRKLTYGMITFTRCKGNKMKTDSNDNVLHRQLVRMIVFLTATLKYILSSKINSAIPRPLSHI